jgi:hypothetical protein
MASEVVGYGSGSGLFVLGCALNYLCRAIKKAPPAGGAFLHALLLTCYC